MDLRRDSEGLPPLTSIDDHGSAASMDEERRGGRPGPHAPDAKCSSRSQHKDKQLEQHLHPFPTHGEAAAAADASMKKRRRTPSSSSNNSRCTPPLPSPLCLIPSRSKTHPDLLVYISNRDGARCFCARAGSSSPASLDGGEGLTGELIEKREGVEPRHAAVCVCVRESCAAA